MSTAGPTRRNRHARRLVWASARLSVLFVILAASPAWAGSWQAFVPDARNGEALTTEIDLGTNLTSTIATLGGQSALGVAISPDARTAYVVDAETHNLTPLDLSASPPLASAPVDLEGSPPPSSQSVPLNIALAPNGRVAYVPDSANGRVMPVDLTGPTPVLGSPISVGGEPQGVAFTPDGSTAYVANFADGTVTPINVASNTPGTPIKAVGTHPYEIAITPDGKTAYVTDNASNKVFPISLPAGTVGTPIEVAEAGLVGIAITPDGSKAYVASFGTISGGTGTGTRKEVTPINLSTNKAEAPITVGEGPWALAVTPDSKTVYVTSDNNESVIPIDTATNTAGPEISGTLSPRSIAITPDQAPVANFTVASAPPGSATSFDASSSTVQFGTIASYAWNFGDGTGATSSSPSISHVYTTAGNYTASVTETDSAGTSNGGTVYTGQSASRVGSPSAQTSRGVVIAAPASSLAAGSLAVIPSKPVPQPILGRTVVAQATSGTVLVRARGSSRFVVLQSPAEVSVGSEVDATAGSVTFTVARNGAGATATVTVSGGRFLITQSAGPPPLTTFTLTLPLTGCPKLASARRARVARRRKGPTKRHITVSETAGGFATRGQYVATSVEGTQWTTADSCGSSSVSVARGAVRVTDLVRHKSLTLRSRQSYTARARR